MICVCSDSCIFEIIMRTVFVPFLHAYSFVRFVHVFIILDLQYLIDYRALLYELGPLVN